MEEDSHEERAIHWAAPVAPLLGRCAPACNCRLASRHPCCPARSPASGPRLLRMPAARHERAIPSLSEAGFARSTVALSPRLAKASTPGPSNGVIGAGTEDSVRNLFRTAIRNVETEREDRIRHCNALGAPATCRTGSGRARSDRAGDVKPSSTRRVCALRRSRRSTPIRPRRRA